MKKDLTSPHFSDLARFAPYIEETLGRKPRGLRAIAAFNHLGDPAVIRVASLVENKPFPTLFWLIDPAVNLYLDRLEAGGDIAKLQAKVDNSSALQKAMMADHVRHKLLRESYLTNQERAFLNTTGMMVALEQRGIGGIAEPDRIRCLHTWYAAHLVEPNTIGALIDNVIVASPWVPQSE